MELQVNHKDTIQFCVDILDGYDPVTQELDQYLDETLTEIINLRGLDENTETFIIKVITGCARYNQVLAVVTNGFYSLDGKFVLHSEENLYKVICYLALFQLDEIGMANFRRFVRSQDVNKMYKFLQFFINEKYLRTWIKDEWNKCYQASFVQTTLLSPTIRWLPELIDLVSQLQATRDNKNIKRKPKSSIEMKPFNITQPRPRTIPVPAPIPKIPKHRPLSKSIFNTSREQTNLSKQKEINRRVAEERLMEASRMQFSCANPEKSEKTQKKIQAIMEEQQKMLDFDRHKSHPIPDGMLDDNIPVKLNAASILREAKLYKKREKDELKRLESLQAGEYDDSKFVQWQSKMRQADLDAQLADIERRRLEGKLSLEDAILARADLIQNNREKVAEMKAQAEQLMQEYLEKRLKEEKVMRELVETVMSSHSGAKEARVKLQAYKARLVQEVNAESQELMRQALEQAEEEMQQRMLLIQQIRAMEATPVIRDKIVDLTETAGYGFLNEMSIAELNEQICHMKIKRASEEEEKRDEILASKQAKDEMLISTLETISRHRKEQSKAAALKLENKKKMHNEKPVLQNERLTDLERRLRERRALRVHEQEKARVDPCKKSVARLNTLNDTKKTVEQNRWAEMERASEQSARRLAEGVGSSKAAAKLLLNGRGLVGATH